MAEPSSSSSSSSPSLPHEGDVVEGHFKILREKGVEYEVLDIQTGKVSSKHYSLNEVERYTHSHLPEFKHYQVGGINIYYDCNGLNSASVELLLLQGPQGEKVEGGERTLKVVEKGKIREIRDALEKGGHDVYCAVFSHWGVEALGDIKSLPKDPLILRLPEEMMDMICGYLDERDLCSLRLVSPLIPRRYLPIHKVWRIGSFYLEADENKSEVSILRKNKRGGRMRYVHHREPHLDFMNEGYAELLRTTKVLSVKRSKSRGDEELLTAVKTDCTNLEKITLTFPEVFEQDLISQLIFRNQGTLKELKIYFSVYSLMSYDFDFSSFSGCKGLMDLTIQCGRIVNLESLASLKDTLKYLYLNKLKEPLRKDQGMWISKNLPNVGRLELDVSHDCFHPKVGEIDVESILSILEGIDKSVGFHLTIYLHNCTVGENGRHKHYCGKASGMWKQVLGALKDKGELSQWISYLSHYRRTGLDNFSTLDFWRKDEHDYENSD